MMKTAVTYESGLIFQHFGHTAAFKIYEVDNNEVKSSKVVETNGSGHGALAGFLAQLGVDTLICGGSQRRSILVMTTLTARPTRVKTAISFTVPSRMPMAHSSYGIRTGIPARLNIRFLSV